MKKRKIYEISIIDKTYSKTISDETKFYTSDTSLELVFKLKETEYTFESAEIVLLNIDDRSLVTRPVAKVLDSFTYELDDDITAHYGEWRGQLRFEQAGEIYVSSPVKFRIENDLSNERPPQLSDVQSWASLKRYADSLTDELKQAVLSVEELEGTLKENETTRQTVFDDNEAGRDETFNANEATRQENETTRQQAETQRLSAESSRASSESQRKTDHANRSAELAGKANKKQEDWKTPTLLNGWTNFGGVYETVGYMKDEFGFVHLRGMIKGGTVGQNAFMLPEGYKPLKSQYHMCISADIVRTLNVQNNGGVFISSAASSNWVTLNGISFKAGV